MPAIWFRLGNARQTEGDVIETRGSRFRSRGWIHSTLEEPTDFHSAFPNFPMPGVAQGVLRGVLPGAEINGRMVFNAQGGATEGSMRAGVMIASPP